MPGYGVCATGCCTIARERNERNGYLGALSDDLCKRTCTIGGGLESRRVYRGAPAIVQQPAAQSAAIMHPSWRWSGILGALGEVRVLSRSSMTRHCGNLSFPRVSRGAFCGHFTGPCGRLCGTLRASSLYTCSYLNLYTCSSRARSVDSVEKLVLAARAWRGKRALRLNR